MRFSLRLWFQSFLLFCLLAGLRLPGQLAGPEQRRLADGLYARGLYDLALVEYQKLIEKDPPPENLDLIYYRAGECAARLDQDEQAAAAYRKALELGGTGAAAQRSRFRLADEAYRKGDLAEAEELLKVLLASEMEASIEVPARYTYAQILENRGQTEQALVLYRKLLADFPAESLSAYAALRVAALAQEDAETKKAFYRKALENPPTRDFEVEALWGLARLESRTRNLKEAAAIYWKLWKQFPDSTRVRGSMIYLAWAQLQAGEFQRALDLADATSDTRKAADADTWAYLEGVSFQGVGKTEEAFQKFSELVEKYPQSRFRSFAVFEVAGRLAEKGEHAKVLTFAEDLQQVPGNEVEALWLLAESSRAAGEPLSAIRLYTRIAHQYPEHGRAADALYFKALMLSASENAEAGAKALFEFQRKFPEDPRALGALEQSGDLLVKSGDLASGRGRWLEVLRLRKDPQPELLFKTAMLELRLELFADAQAHLQQFLTRELREEPRALGQYWLGVVLDRRGMGPESQTALELALKTEALPANLQTEARLRLGQSYTRNDHPEKALAAFLPLFGTEKEAGLSDALLIWLLSVAEEQQAKETIGKIASAMVTEQRKAATRELGYYQQAELAAAAGRIPEARQAWEKGLAFQSETREAVNAHLAFADFQLKNGAFDSAFTHYRETTRLASAREEGRLQALGMLGCGRAEAGRGDWDSAARHFMSVAVLFEDPVLSPEALRLAADAFRRAGLEKKALAAEQELQTRYPSPAETNP